VLHKCGKIAAIIEGQEKGAKNKVVRTS